MKRKRNELRAEREALPIWFGRERLLQLIRSGRNLVIVGETGSGKTTQLPQFILDAWNTKASTKNTAAAANSTDTTAAAAAAAAADLAAPRDAFDQALADDARRALQTPPKAPPPVAVVVSQPRRVAAITVAERVAEERGCKIGEDVGYAVRFERRQSQRTRILFATDGLLLRELMLDRLLLRYRVVLLDEAHERSVATDILFALLKRVQRARRRLCAREAEEAAAARGSGAPHAARVFSPLQVIVTSATLDADAFCAYFDARAVYVQGRQYPVRVHHTLAAQSDVQYAALCTVLQVHRAHAAEPGDILVFLAGQDEIESVGALLRERAALVERVRANGGAKDEPRKLVVRPLYAALPTRAQLAAFAPAAADERKVILSTNIAETSVTVSGVRFVVDSGRVKVSSASARTGLETLRVRAVSQASAWQRVGRAGRESAGEAFRLFTASAYEGLAAVDEPEIVRASLTSVVLQLRALGVDDVLRFDYLTPPPRPALRRALRTLLQLRAFDAHGALTKLGSLLAKFPLEPRYALVLVHASGRGAELAARADGDASDKSGSVAAAAAVDGDAPPASMRAAFLRTMVRIVALVSLDDQVFVSPHKQRDEADAAKRRMAGGASGAATRGDPFVMLRAYEEFLTENGSRVWCERNFINRRALQKASRIEEQLLDICKRVELAPNAVEVAASGTRPRQVSRADWERWAARCLVRGLFTAVAVRQRTALEQTGAANGGGSGGGSGGGGAAHYRTLADPQDVAIHPASVLQARKPECVLFTELVSTTKNYMRGVIAIDFKWLPELVPNFFKLTAGAAAASTSNGN